jgi:hypothetical protein
LTSSTASLLLSAPRTARTQWKNHSQHPARCNAISRALLSLGKINVSCALIAARAKYFAAAAALYDAVCLISVIAPTKARNVLFCVEA